MNINVILGCNGNVSSNRFCYCSSVENIILDISNIPIKEQEKILDFLDDTCGLFNEPCYDYSKTINIIKILYKTFEVIDEEMLESIQGFIRMHKSCGLILRLKEKVNE